MIYKLIVIILCSVLFRLGGWKFKMARRAIMPIVLAGFCAWYLRNWWVFLTVGAGCQVMGMGYGEDSPLYKLLGAWLARGAWAALTALAITVGLLVAKESVFLWGFPYLALNFAVGSILCKNEAPDYIIEPALGAGIASIVFFI